MPVLMNLGTSVYTLPYPLSQGDLRRRAHLGDQVEIDSDRGRGTRVRIRVPVVKLTGTE